MIKFKKVLIYNKKIVSLIVSIFFLFTTTPYSFPASSSKDSLRLHIGDKDGDDTFERMTDAMHQVLIDEPLERAAEEAAKSPEKSRLQFISMDSNPKISEMLTLFETVGVLIISKGLF